jgi:putative hydrolase of the HAD superfamily
VSISYLFFDVGGVLGTNGWDAAQRAAGVVGFGLDAREFDQRHREVVGVLETGAITLDEYLDATVFYEPRPFDREAVKAFMRAQSRPYPDVIALARGLAATGRYRLMTINNESEELNRHRLACFGLAEIFVAFYSSCWLGVAKPTRRIFELALDIAQADPARSLFIDDREQNLDPARALGMHALRFAGTEVLRRQLTQLGVTV